jgi:hypothetical protein
MIARVHLVGTSSNALDDTSSLLLCLYPVVRSVVTLRIVENDGAVPPNPECLLILLVAFLVELGHPNN